MKIFGLLALSAGLFIAATATGFAQYYGGGMGRPMGGGMGGMGMGQSQANFKPNVPNIAGELANRETKWLKEKLNLTKEQAKAVKDLNNEYGKQQQEAIKEIVALNGSGKPSEAQNKQIRDAMMMYNEDKETKLKPILTPEQWALYQTSKDDMQREVGGIRPPAPPEFRTKKDSTKAN
ncbi:hypothetical protein FAES_1726 [Fibrella aestuarina BUZ 2]|uniref:Uncharacterized protein n=1 Tax=Fibrella aestuarina BUZ 2 TaxID=1166018 RepID=I0K6I3_9BACT|nr:hypothetical protein [Fibrella aestuarina]CCG99736.1 hypothetical protein FAES_1726 [Fibrella aestuarina BUZ 2]